MAKGKRKSSTGRKVAVLMSRSAESKHSAGMTHGGTEKIGRTENVPKSKYRPGTEFAKPRGGSKGSKSVSDEKLFSPLVKRARKEKKK